MFNQNFEVQYNAVNAEIEMPCSQQEEAQATSTMTSPSACYTLGC